MALNQSLAIIAMARLCGIEGESQEIVERFMSEYQKAGEETAKTAEPVKVEVFKRPY